MNRDECCGVNCNRACASLCVQWSTLARYVVTVAIVGAGDHELGESASAALATLDAGLICCLRSVA